MGVIRTRTTGLYAHANKARANPREGTFVAHQPSSWTTSSAECGGHVRDQYKAPRPRPQSAMAKVLANPPNHIGRLSSEAVGFETGIKPAVRPRPASDATVQLRNPAIAHGTVSAEVIGLYTVFPPRKTDDPQERNRIPRSRTNRPTSAPLWTRTMRASDVIGTHPPPEPIDATDAVALHFEAQFAHKFGRSGIKQEQEDGTSLRYGHKGAVLSSGASTMKAVEFQKQWIARAEALNRAHRIENKIEEEEKTKRYDGEVCSRHASSVASSVAPKWPPPFTQTIEPCWCVCVCVCHPVAQMMQKMNFDAVYSNQHVEKDTGSGLGKDMVPVVDPRRDQFTRPKDAKYGRMHQISTAYGLRQPLPSRTFLGIGEGRGRAQDF